MVCEFDEFLPIIRFNRVAAFPKMVANMALDDGAADGRKGLFGKSDICAEQAIDFSGMIRREILAAGVSPCVAGATVYVNGAWCDTGKEHVLVDGKIVFLLDKFPRVATEPVGKTSHHFLEGFP